MSAFADVQVRSISPWQHLFGLSQLHQLRGRVGRGALQAYAYVMHPELERGSKALRRLQVMEEESALGCGFAISRCDLQLRGAGKLFAEEIVLETSEPPVASRLAQAAAQRSRKVAPYTPAEMSR